MEQETAPRRNRARNSCAWCGREIVESDIGRRRKYCKQSCRQRAYEQRSLVAGSSIPADAVVLSAGEADDLIERLFRLRCAAEDIATAVDENAGKNELASLGAELVALAKEAERWR
ncbi:hypothetical protein [Williamsia soli]|uniref:hypothetical protein n=1 Tax=Williamsia soli TaxID=364929 RepID=UPI001A9FA57C|nr:hypothetical protein [Williamsia soli]